MLNSSSVLVVSQLITQAAWTLAINSITQAKPEDSFTREPETHSFSHGTEYHTEYILVSDSKVQFVALGVVLALEWYLLSTGNKIQKAVKAAFTPDLNHI